MTDKKPTQYREDERFTEKVPTAKNPRPKSKSAVEKIKGLNNIDLGNGFSVKIHPPKLKYKYTW